MIEQGDLAQLAAKVMDRIEEEYGDDESASLVRAIIVYEVTYSSPDDDEDEQSSSVHVEGTDESNTVVAGLVSRAHDAVHFGAA